MIPRKYRLTQDWEIKRVFQKGKRKHTHFFVLNWYPNKLGNSRFAFLASKKVGKAVQRNRAVRLLRESVRHLLNNFPQGWDFVLVARKNIESQKMQEVREEMNKVIAKINAL